MNQPAHLLIGIDPGTKTGLAIMDARTGQFLSIETLPIHIAMLRVAEAKRDHPAAVHVIVEDARQRKWLPKNSGREKLQGAGSIKRDCAIWEGYLAYLGLPYLMRPPRPGTTKWGKAYWQKTTGWKGRTSEHARDAALLVHGMGRGKLKSLKWTKSD